MRQRWVAERRSRQSTIRRLTELRRHAYHAPRTQPEVQALRDHDCRAMGAQRRWVRRSSPTCCLIRGIETGVRRGRVMNDLSINRLSLLAAAINAEHRAAYGFAGEAVKHAAECGRPPD